MTTTGFLAKLEEFAAAIASTVITRDDSKAAIDTESGLALILEQLRRTRLNCRHVFIIGNGGSAAVASHAVTDLTNVSRLRALTLHEAAILTCMANDYGYETAYSRLIATHAQEHDVLIAISSSGKSANICNAAKAMRGQGGMVVTLSGFAVDNALRSLGHYNIWVNSKDYGIVEIAHLFLLHNLADKTRSWECN